MWRIINLGAIVVAVLTGLAVMQLKFAVRERRDAVEELADKIRDDKEHIRVLEAEWSLLASPELLEERSRRFLALMQVRPDQIVSDPLAIPMRRKGEEAEGETDALLNTASTQNHTQDTDANNTTSETASGKGQSRKHRKGGGV